MYTETMPLLAGHKVIIRWLLTFLSHIRIKIKLYPCQWNGILNDFTHADRAVLSHNLEPYSPKG